MRTATRCRRRRWVAGAPRWGLSPDVPGRGLLDTGLPPAGTLLANSRAGGLGDLLRPRGAQRDAPEPEAVDDDDVATVQPRGPSRHGAGRAGGVPQGMPGDPDPRRARRA